MTACNSTGDWPNLASPIAKPEERERVSDRYTVPMPETLSPTAPSSLVELTQQHITALSDLRAEIEPVLKAPPPAANDWIAIQISMTRFDQHWAELGRALRFEGNHQLSAETLASSERLYEELAAWRKRVRAHLGDNPPVSK